MRSFESLQRDVERQNRATADSFRNVADSIEGNTSRIDRARERYERLSNAAVRAEVELQRAAQANSRAQADANASAAEREAALRRLEAATKSYKAALQDAKREEDRFSESGARGRARRVADQATEIAQLRELQRQAQNVAREEERLSRERQQRQARELDAPRRYLELLRQIQRIERDRARAADIGDTVTTARLDFDDREARRKAQVLADELRILFRRAEINVNLDDAEARRHAVELLAMKSVLGRDIELNVDVDIGAAQAKLALFEQQVQRANRPGALGILSGSIRETADAFTNASQKIATFDNFLRGLAAISVFAFFNQLILLAGSAASNLISLASSASYAGAALGGGLVAGLAQALPMLGILAAALTRFKAVSDAVRQSDLLQQQESYRAPARNRRIADSIDQVRNAQERLSDANRRQQQAQEQLTQARETARRKLEDLILTERGATLSVEESQTAIRNASSVSDLDRAFLTRDEARLNLRRVSGELATRRTVGIEGSPEVKSAQDQVLAARRAVDEARRGIDRAARSAAVAGNEVTAAAGKLNYLLDRLSPAERRLYTALQRFQDEFRRVSQVIVEPIIDATVRGLGRITDIMTDPAVMRGMTGLSEQMVKAGNRVFDAATSDQAVRQWLRITEQARENLLPVANILVNVGRGFMDIAEGAGPALHQMVLFFRDITRSAAEFLSDARRSGELTAFFLEGVRHLKAWADLLWQIVRLFAAITGAGGGADAGFRLVTRLADAIGGLADRVNDTDSRLSRFFRTFFEVGQRMLFAMLPVLQSLAREFASLFTEDGVRSVQSFAFFLSDVLIPAVGQFARTVGQATTFIGELFRQFPILRDMMVGLIATMLTLSVGGKLAVVFTPIIAPLRFLVRLLGTREQILVRILGLLSRIPIIGAGLAGLAGRLGGGAAAGAGAAGAAGVVGGAAAGAAGDVARQGSRLGGIFGGTFGAAAKGLLKKAGWIGVGISAVDGLMSAFRYNSVEAGVRDFANSMSFGLVDSFEETTRKRIDSALEGIRDQFEEAARTSLDRNLTRALGRINPLRLGTQEKSTRDQVRDLLNPSYGGFYRPSTREATPFQRLVDEVRKIDPYFARLIAGTSRYGESINRISRSLRTGLSDFITGDLARNSGSLNRYIDTLTALLDQAPRTRPWRALRDEWERLRNDAIRTRKTLQTELDIDKLNFNFGLALQQRDIDVSRAIGGYIRHLRRLPPEARREAADSMLNLARGLEDRRAVPEGTARKFSRRIGDAMTTWTTRSTRRGARAMSDMATIMSGMSNIVAVSMGDMIRGVNSALSAFGIGGIRMPREISRRDLTTGARVIGGLAGFLSDAVFARGGFVGNRGERGTDAVPAILGRGEAVLNWAHQRMVEPALRAFYGIGLGDMFRRTRGFHAGTGGVAGAYAGGGFTGPAGSGEGFIPISNFAANRFGLQMTAGRTDHSYYTSSGNVSDHTKGMAGDFSNSTAPTPQMDGFNAFWKTRLPQTIKQLIWRNIDQFQGFPVGGHMDHVHLAVHPAYAFNSALMARLISRASKGLSISRLLSSVGSMEMGGDDVDHVHRVIIRGRGKLRDYMQRALDRVQRGANRYIDRKANTDLGNIVDGPNDIDLLPKGKGVSVGASEFGGPSDIGTGTTGYRGDNLALKPDSYAELSNNPGMGVGADFAALGGLPYMTKLRITGPRGSAIAYKRDVGAGGGAVGGLPRAIDLWYTLANALGVSGLSPVKIQRLAQGGLAKIQQFATGGHVRGPDGQPVPIIAHAGEWVLNRMQQSRLAKMVGLGVDQVKGLLGFPGESPKTTHFADGGEVRNVWDGPGSDSVQVEGTRATERNTKAVEENTRATRDEIEARRKDRENRANDAYETATSYAGPRFNIAPTTFRDISSEINSIFRAISRIGSGRVGRAETFGDQVDRFNRNMRYLIGENGYLFTIGEAIDAFSSRLALGLSLAQAGLRRVGFRLRRRRPLTDAVAIAEQSIDNLEEINRDIGRARTQIIRALRANRQRLNRYLRSAERENTGELRELLAERDPSRRDSSRIRELRRLLEGRRIEDRLTQRQLDRYTFLRRADDDLLRLLDDNTQRRIDNITARQEAVVQRREALVARFQTRTDRFLARPARNLAITDAMLERARINERDEDVIAPLLQRRLGGLNREQDVIRNRLARARAAARRNPAMRAVADELEEQLRQINTDIIQATRDIADNQLARLQRQLDAVFASFDERNAGLSREQQIASIFGRTGALTNVTQRSLDLAVEEMNTLSAMLGQYHDPEMRRQITDRINDLSVTVADLTSQLLDAAIDAVERENANRERRLGLRDRLANLRERAGDRLGAIQQRQGISDDRLGGLQSDRNHYQDLLMRAMLEGNEGAVQELTEKLEDLDVAIQEETATRRDLVYEYRQAALDIVTGQTDRSTGLIGSARDLFQKLADISGSEATAMLLRLAQQTATLLRDEATRIIERVNEALGGGEFTGQAGGVLAALSAAFGQGPEAFASKLAELAPIIAALESTMSEAERDTFQRLVQAMLENTGAVVDNTRETRDLTNSITTPQTWASSSWNWFREAIFNGMGDVLPQYRIPQLHSGGTVGRGGLFELAPGEIVINPRGDNMPKTGDLNITVNEAGQPMDITHLANRMAFEMKSQR
jgi:hypothetical protein